MSHCPECGAVFECPVCLGRDVQVGKMERELRAARGKVTKLEREREVQKVAKRDGAVWKRILGAYREAFPDKRLSATGIKSARATAVFQRMEQGATVEDWLAVIRGGKEYPFVVYGERRRSGSQADRADDLQDFAHLHKDRLFEFLRDAGRVPDA